MHAVPSGFVLLVEWPEEALSAYLARDLAAPTPRTLIDPARVRERLAEVRAAGYAWGLEEFAEGIDSIAAPIRDARGHAIAALHVHGPSYRFPVPGDEARVAGAVASAAAEVSRLLGRAAR